MTIHVTLWSLLGVVGSIVWVLVAFYIAAGIAVLSALGGGGPEWWINLKAALVGCAVIAILIGIPLGLAAWRGAL